MPARQRAGQDNLRWIDVSGLGAHFSAELTAEITAYCGANPQLDLVIIDPLGKFAGPESPELNSQEGGAYLVNYLDELRKATGCTILALHHVRKGNEGMTQDAATGSKQLVDFSRWVMNLQRVNQTKQII